MTKWKELQTELTEKIKAIEETLPSSLAEFSLEQIQNVQEHLKNLEDNIKEKHKEKSKRLEPNIMKSFFLFLRK
jgi:gas vesicle protein